MTAIDISYNTFSYCWENTVHHTKPHWMTLLPFALEGSANRALVVGCFMATGHATCFKQTSCLSTKKKKKTHTKYEPTIIIQKGLFACIRHLCSPWISRMFLDPARWWSSSMFCVMTVTLRPCLLRRSSHSAMAR